MIQQTETEVAALSLPGGELGPLAEAWTPAVEPTTFQLNESDYDISTGITVEPGQRLVINAWGEIWAGVWFTGRNGPQGWLGWHAGPDSPLPFAAPFSVLGRLEGRYFYVGTGIELIYRPPAGVGGSQLWLRINDNTPGNGWGAFSAHVEVYQPTS
jgi:hypothetical protein